MALKREIRDLGDLEPAIQKLSTFPAGMLKAAETAMHASVSLFEAEVTERTPVGATSILRGSIFGEVKPITGQEVVGMVGSPEIYALPVEEGRLPGKWPPRGALLQWVERVLGLAGKQAEQVEFLIRRKIGQKGTKGAHMFAEGWKASEGRIKAIWRKIGRDLTQRHFKS